MEKTSLSGNVTLREMASSDSEKVLDIYKMGIETKMATFESKVPAWKEFNKNHLSHSRYVVEKSGKVVGWIALSPVSKREAYKGVAEISVYVDPINMCVGLGSLLMEKAIDSSEANGIWTLFSSVFPENRATVKLHRKFGFRIVGTREKIGLIDGKWRDTVILERRSKKIGL
jgi:L-amino acid N-acyltransferase YncA